MRRPTSPSLYLPYARLATRQFQLGLASARVIQTRLARAAAYDPRALAPRDRAELTRMVTEKVFAGAESGQAWGLGILAWQASLARAWVGMFAAPWLGVGSSPLQVWQRAMQTGAVVTRRHAPRIVSRALTPIARRAHANDRRLARATRTAAGRS